jgi:hypothetical protein
MTSSAIDVNLEHEQIAAALVEYILSQYPSKFIKETLSALRPRTRLQPAPPWTFLGKRVYGHGKKCWLRGCGL